MIENIKFYLKGVLIMAGLFLAYTLGQSNRPNLSFESAYDIVKNEANDRQESIVINGDRKDRTSYIPAYSHIYISEGQPLKMAVTLSLRNIDKKNEVQIQEIFYYNTQGEVIRQYLKDGYTLKPLETKEIFIKRTDTDGGSGANFYVIYNLDENGSEPIFETVMTAIEGYGNSYVFSSRGQTL